MSRIRRLFSRIASAATMISAAIPISAIFSSSLSASSKDDPVIAANRFHTGVFIAYVVILVLAAGFQWWVWSTGNRLQDAIRANSDARIAEARAEGAKANERAEKLEQENIGLRRDLNTESGKVATLQKDASNAKAAQQKVEIDLSKQKEITANAEKDVAGLKRLAAEQQERAAKAELALLKLQEAAKDRVIPVKQKAHIAEALTAFRGQSVEIRVFGGDRETTKFANDVAFTLEMAGLKTEVNLMATASISVEGIGIVVRDSKSIPPLAMAIISAFMQTDFPMSMGTLPDIKEGSFLIFIGGKAPLR